MWIFYYDIAQPTSQAFSDVTIFLGMTLMTGVVILLPSFLERKNK